ncbi:MAG: ABC transporter permease [Candidatus ainarchaeum sp.]|nr:ABC transporter permease [Candidatus ainarchaeum sp.]
MQGGIEIVEVAIDNLSHQGLRTYLTILGVIIGIAAIVTFVALGDGLNNAVIDQFETLGSNTIFIAPAGSMSMEGSLGVEYLQDAEINKIKRIPEISQAFAPLMTSTTVEFGNQKKSVSIIGYNPNEVKDLVKTGFVKIGEGREIKSSDGYVAIVGYGLANDTFDKKIRLRGNILINGKSFRVVGITAEASTSFGGGPNTNTTILINENAYKATFEDSKPMFMMATTKKKEDVLAVQKKIERIFEQKYGKDQKTFTIVTSAQILDSINQVMGLIQLFIVGIASISLFVGGIGIMNTMIMSVMERTSEIGVMKAIGATNGLILSIFILEAGLIGLFGGIIGVTLGYGLAFLVGMVAGAMNFALSVRVDFLLILGALAFSMFVGIASGVYPARRAAMLDPVEALRKGSE